MGGRGSGSNMGGGAVKAMSPSTSENLRVSGGSKTGDFVQVSNGVWESEKQHVTAAALTGQDRHVVAERSAGFVIERGEYKGGTVYRLYERHLGNRFFLKRFRSLKDAAKYANR